MKQRQFQKSDFNIRKLSNLKKKRISERLRIKEIAVNQLKREIEILEVEQKLIGFGKFPSKKGEKLALLKREYWHHLSGYRKKRIKFVQGGAPGLGRRR